MKARIWKTVYIRSCCGAASIGAPLKTETLQANYRRKLLIQKVTAVVGLGIGQVRDGDITGMGAWHIAVFRTPKLLHTSSTTSRSHLQSQYMSAYVNCNVLAYLCSAGVVGLRADVQIKVRDQPPAPRHSSKSELASLPLSHTGRMRLLMQSIDLRVLLEQSNISLVRCLEWRVYQLIPE